MSISREERHYRNVAALPCAQCGIDGYSQAAHSNLARHGKGGALKAHYKATFPLCCVRPGPGGHLVVGCHIKHDQYIGITYEEAEARTERYLVWTEAQLRARGQWPEDVLEEVKVSKHARKPIGLKSAARTKNKSRDLRQQARGSIADRQKKAMSERILKQSTDKEKPAHRWPTRTLQSVNRLGGRK